MNQDVIFGFLRDLIMDMKEVDEGSIEPTSTFESLGLDSLDFVELQVAVKKKFKVDLLPENFSSGKIVNMNQIVAYIDAEMAGD